MQNKIKFTGAARWDNHFLEMAILNAKMSKDPSTKVGAIITSADNHLISAGFNGLPRGIEDTEDRLNYRDLKLQLVVHAEMNSVLAAAKLGVKLKNSTMYIAATNTDGAIWGGPPCTRCLVEIIQTGITKIISYKRKNVPTKWEKDLDFSMSLIKEVGIKYLEYNIDTGELNV